VEHAVRTPDGRTLAVEESGDPAGRPVLVHMGTPAPRRLYGPHVRDAAARGLRLISYDRPGYGGSSPQPGAPSPTAPAMSARSALSSASTGWARGASQAVARTCSRARPCSRTW
jgi:pimeloyl-ACP methyl ester carboxylesterase